MPPSRHDASSASTGMRMAEEANAAVGTFAWHVGIAQRTALAQPRYSADFPDTKKGPPRREALEFTQRRGRYGMVMASPTLL